MSDDTPSDATKPDKGPSTPDDEASADLSRAAREAVRQPADPRLEKQFAYLGLWGEPEPPSPAAPVGETKPLAEALGRLEVTSTGLEARLDGVMRLLAVVIRLLVVLTVVVIGLAILVVAGSLT